MEIYEKNMKNMRNSQQKIKCRANPQDTINYIKC